MKPQRKKIIWIVISIFVFIFALLILLPFVFENKIKTLAKNELNKTLNAVVDFDDVDVSFIRSFPQVSFLFKGFSFSGIGIFDKDTMLKSDVVDLTVNIKSFFKDEGYDIRKLRFKNAKVLFHYLPGGQFNWTSFLKEDTTVVDTMPMMFHFKLKEFEVENSDILYHDEQGDILVTLRNVNHTLTGDLTADSSLLVTRTTVDALTFSNDGFEYMTNVKMQMDADINANVNDMIFTFSKNTVKMNDLPFSLNGWFRTVKGGIAMDFALVTETVDFKSLLSLVPVLYSKSFDQIQAGGKVDMKGFLKGEYAGDYYPSFDLDLKVADGWFKYPSLPRQVEKINISANLFNKGNTLDETIIDVSRFTFLLGGNPIDARLRIATPVSDPDLKLDAKGKINLGMIREVYPLDKNIALNGNVALDVKLTGKMSYYEKNQYDKFNFGGNLRMTDLLMKTESFDQPLEIAAASFDFHNRYVNLNTFDAKLGKNDISAEGKLENLIAYLLSDKTLKGTLSLKSNYLNVNDFLKTNTPEEKNTEAKASEKETQQAKRAVILPKNLDFTMKGSFKEILYDKMNLKNATGILTLVNSELKFTDMTMQAFGGNLKLSGLYNTVDTLKPIVNLNMDLKNIVFNDIFKQVDVIQNFMPLFNKATGSFNTGFSFNALLKNGMMPDLLTIFSRGNFNTELVSLKDVPVLEKIVQALNRKDLLPMSLKDLGISFEIDEGKLLTKPFSFKLKDVGLTLGGITGLDKSIDYKGTVTLPDKLKLGRFSTYNVTIGGTFDKPDVKLDLKGMVTELATEAVEKVETEINKKVDDAKEDARKRKDKAMRDAQQKADKLIMAADSVGNLLILQAEKQGQELVKRANNPITKAAAQAAARKLTDEARKKAAETKAKAQTEARKIIQKADESVEI